MGNKIFAIKSSKRRRVMLFKYREKLLAIILFLSLLFSSCGDSQQKKTATTSGKIEGKKVAIVVGQRYFREEELHIPKAMLEKEGASITIVSSRLSFAEGDTGSKIKPNILIDDLDVFNFDAVVFIGGSAVKKDFWENPKAHAVCREALKQGKVLAAICWGPVVLANAGVLEGKKATGHHAQGADEILKSKGCFYTGESVTVDGNIVTAYGPSSADSFAVAIVDALR
jgi:protease I